MGAYTPPVVFVKGREEITLRPTDGGFFILP